MFVVCVLLVDALLALNEVTLATLALLVVANEELKSEYPNVPLI